MLDQRQAEEGNESLVPTAHAGAATTGKNQPRDLLSLRKVASFVLHLTQEAGSSDFSSCLLSAASGKNACAPSIR